MTDEQIIKALEVHSNEKFDNCEGCPYLVGDFCEGFTKHSKPFRDVIDLINRQQAEIDRYKGVIKILEKDVAEARNEGVKELAHQLIDKAEKGIVWVFDIVDLCHDLTNVLPKEGTDV